MGTSHPSGLLVPERLRDRQDRPECDVHQHDVYGFSILFFGICSNWLTESLNQRTITTGPGTLTSLVKHPSPTRIPPSLICATVPFCIPGLVLTSLLVSMNVSSQGQSLTRFAPVNLGTSFRTQYTHARATHLIPIGLAWYGRTYHLADPSCVGYNCAMRKVSDHNPSARVCFSYVQHRR